MTAASYDSRRLLRREEAFFSARFVVGHVKDAAVVCHHVEKILGELRIHPRRAAGASRARRPGSATTRIGTTSVSSAATDFVLMRAEHNQ